MRMPRTGVVVLRDESAQRRGHLDARRRELDRRGQLDVGRAEPEVRRQAGSASRSSRSEGCSSSNPQPQCLRRRVLITLSVACR